MDSTGTPDVIVVGAGIIGASVARNLAKGGMRVRLVDAGEAGRSATWAAAGMLSPGGEFDSDSVWLRMGLASMKLYPGWIEELREESGVPIDYRVCGALERAAEGNSLPQLAERCRRQAQLGIRCEMRDGWAFYPDDAVVDPRELFRALRMSCRRLGVEIREHERVDRIDDREAVVVIAAGARSGSIQVFTGDRRVPIPATTPVKGHLLAYALEPGSLPSILRRGHTYLFQRSSGLVIAGSTAERVGFDETVSAALCQEIHQRAALLWPELARHEPCDCWTGLRPATEHGEPVIGPVEGTRVWLAYGHYRNGILLAPVTAEKIAAGILAAHKPERAVD